MKVNISLSENLKEFVGRKVYVTLSSGKTFIGTVKELGDELIQLEKLDDKEFFDALIRIDNIVAIHSRYRQLRK